MTGLHDTTLTSNCTASLKNHDKSGNSSSLQEEKIQTKSVTEELTTTIDNYEMSIVDVVIEETSILGKGQFGIVFRGKLVKTGTNIAAKMLHEANSNSALTGMMNEIKLLCKIGDHRNVVKFIGFCTSKTEYGVLSIIMELCEGGGLISLLRSKKHVGLSEDFSFKTLLQFAHEIASGMEYIENKKIIHGDLAARNVLLDGNQTCKIGDFGLSRQLYDYTEYVKTSKDPLPWRWMAYESLCFREFSAKSDVWMYGITVWEIFSLGVIPYPGHSWNQTFVEEIEKGLRPSCPKLATPEIYQLMTNCCNLNPDDRPSFAQILQNLDTIIDQ